MGNMLTLSEIEEQKEAEQQPKKIQVWCLVVPSKKFKSNAIGALIKSNAYTAKDILTQNKFIPIIPGEVYWNIENDCVYYIGHPTKD